MTGDLDRRAAAGSESSSATGVHNGLDAAIRDLDQLTRGHDYTYYTDIAHFMAGRDLDFPSGARWYDGDQAVRERWRALVNARQDRLRASGR
ncbi:hypothetical protein [Kitasatospora sp. NPDC001547]|uniref:hypothetical protein n=1 Tax=Kitasatospora sp. NPDC001547 TaxID=3364015 RepID=UPI0036A6CDED